MKFMVVAVLAAGLLLILGLVWLVALLVVMNGVSEAKATQILISYLVLVIVTVIAGGLVGRWGARTLVTNSNWSIWVSGLLIVPGLGLGGAIVQVIGSIVLMLLFGVR